MRAQHESGAFPAAPGYAQYDYCWLRDGSFIAHALDAASARVPGAREAAARFHRWVATTLERLEPHVESLFDRRASGDPLGDADFLPARFTLAGAWEKGGWGNFQLDGYGQWLWSLAGHVRAGAQVAAGDSQELPSELAPAARLATRYLAAFWDEPCLDAWEENGGQLHTATLGSVHAGLRDIAPYLPDLADTAKAAAAGTLRYIHDDCVRDGRLIKSIRNEAVDAALLWLAVPFEIYAADDPVMVATAARVESELLGGGVRRYLADTYYGGGEWILLTAWLARYWLHVGRREDAARLLGWVEEQRGDSGALPEQVPGKGNHPRFRAHWLRRWGPPAKQLLWSHAMVALARLEVDGAG